VSDQEQLFEWPVSEPKTPKPKPRFDEHERTEGWHLVANRHKRVGTWHRIKSRTGEGGVRTMCGVVGRIVHDEQARITHCPECESAPDA